MEISEISEVSVSGNLYTAGPIRFFSDEKAANQGFHRDSFK